MAVMQQKPKLWKTTDYSLVKHLHLVKERVADLERTSVVQRRHNRAENEALVVAWKEYCLYYSATNGSFAVCCYLLRTERANPTVKFKFLKGDTASHSAARSGCSDVLKLFANDGWSLELVDDEGRTPASWAHRNGNKECRRILLESKTQCQTHPNKTKSHNTTKTEKDGKADEGNHDEGNHVSARNAEGKGCNAEDGRSTAGVESDRRLDLTSNLERTLRMEISCKDEELQQERSDRTDVERHLKEQISTLQTEIEIQRRHTQALKETLYRKTLECHDLREQLKEQQDIYLLMEAKRASLNSSCEYSQEPKTVLDLQQLVTQLQSKVQEQTKSLLIKERERRELRLQIETLEGGLKDTGEYAWRTSDEAAALLQCPVSVGHVRCIYRKICHRWREVARCLRPITLMDYEIDQAQSSDNNIKEQTYKMLTIWIGKENKRGEKPTLYNLCCALVDAKLKDAAIDAFGSDVIDFVISRQQAT